MELRPVAVDAVALVPLLVLAQRVVDAQPIPRAELREARFDHRGEQQPVVEGGHDRARRLERGDEAAASSTAPAARPARAVRAAAVREEGGVDERLAVAREVHEVGRRGIDGARQRAPRERRTAREPFLLPCHPPARPARARGLRSAGQTPRDASRRAVGAAGFFDRHPGLERAVREVVEDGVGEATGSATQRVRSASPAGCTAPAASADAAGVVNMGATATVAVALRKLDARFCVNLRKSAARISPSRQSESAAPSSRTASRRVRQHREIVPNAALPSCPCGCANCG